MSLNKEMNMKKIMNTNEENKCNEIYIKNNIKT